MASEKLAHIQPIWQLNSTGSTAKREIIKWHIESRSVHYITACERGSKNSTKRFCPSNGTMHACAENLSDLFSNCCVPSFLQLPDAGDLDASLHTEAGSNSRLRRLALEHSIVFTNACRQFRWPSLSPLAEESGPSWLRMHSPEKIEARRHLVRCPRRR